MQTENSTKKRLRAVVSDLESELKGLRRAIHANPELSHREAETASVLALFLQRAGFRVTTDVGGHGLVCEVGPETSTIIGFRCDMDALPLTESTGVIYASRRAGIMHACGHDAHSAILAGLATTLKKMEGDLAVRTRFIFQPAEESADSGALKMIAAGVTEGLSALMGIHVDPGIALGCFGTRNGTMMASVDFLEIEVAGKGGHGAYPEQTTDPIRVSSQLLNALYGLPAEFSNKGEVILSFGQITGGSNHNVIPDTCTIKGTFRTFSTPVREAFSARLKETIARVGEQHKAIITLRQIADAPPVINDSALGAIVERVIVDEFGSGARLNVDPMKASEDFAYYSDKCPTYFLRLGTASGESTSHPLHSSKFDIDERVLPMAVRLLALIALQFSPTHRSLV